MARFSTITPQRSTFCQKTSGFGSQCVLFICGGIDYPTLLTVEEAQGLGAEDLRAQNIDAVTGWVNPDRWYGSGRDRLNLSPS